MKLNKILSIVLIIACLVSMFATNASACELWGEPNDPCPGHIATINGEKYDNITCDEYNALMEQKKIRDSKVTNDEYYNGRKYGLTKTDKYYVNERGASGRYIAPLEVTEEQKLQYRTTQYFDDVPLDAWYAEGVNALAAGGILTGDGKGHFRPNDPVTQAELAVILGRLDINCDLNKPFEPLWGYTEELNWAHNIYVQWCMEYRALAWSAPEYITTTQCARYEVLNALDIYARIINTCMHAGDTKEDMSKDYVAPGCEKYKFPWCIPDLDREGQHNSKDEEYYKIHGNIFRYDGYDRRMYLYGYSVGIDAEGNCGVYNNITRAELANLLYRMNLTYENCIGKDTSDLTFFVG